MVDFICVKIDFMNTKISQFKNGFLKFDKLKKILKIVQFFNGPNDNLPIQSTHIGHCTVLSHLGII